MYTVIINVATKGISMIKTVLTSAILASLVAISPAHAEADGDNCKRAYPIQVLNAVTGRYEEIQSKADRGWCPWSVASAENAVFAPFGDAPDTGGDSYGDSGGDGK